MKAFRFRIVASPAATEEQRAPEVASVAGSWGRPTAHNQQTMVRSRSAHLTHTSIVNGLFHDSTLCCEMVELGNNGRGTTHDPRYQRLRSTVSKPSWSSEGAFTCRLSSLGLVKYVVSYSA